MGAYDIWDVGARFKSDIFYLLGYRQAVRHRVLIPTLAGSNPATPARFLFSYFYLSFLRRCSLWGGQKLTKPPNFFKKRK